MSDREETEAEALARHKADDEEYRAALVDLAATHPPTAECPDPECDVCSFRDCPAKETLHYHHDGCPRCHDPNRRDTVTP